MLFFLFEVSDFSIADHAMHRSGDDRSILSLTLKHDTPAPLLNDHVVGSIEIEVDQLLQLCHGVECGPGHF